MGNFGYSPVDDDTDTDVVEDTTANDAAAEDTPPAADPDPVDPDANPMQAAQTRLLRAQQEFYATPHAQTERPDLVEAIEKAKDDVRSALAHAGHQRS